VLPGSTSCCHSHIIKNWASKCEYVAVRQYYTCLGFQPQLLMTQPLSADRQPNKTSPTTLQLLFSSECCSQDSTKLVAKRYLNMFAFYSWWRARFCLKSNTLNSLVTSAKRNSRRQISGGHTLIADLRRIPRASLYLTLGIFHVRLQR
jgi:hypothetical protein